MLLLTCNYNENHTINFVFVSMLLAWSRKTRPQAGLPDLGTPEIECKVWCDALFWGSIGNLLFRFVIGRYKSGTICYLCLSFAEVYQIQHLHCKNTQFLSYKHQNHQKNIQDSDNLTITHPIPRYFGCKTKENLLNS